MKRKYITPKIEIIPLEDSPLICVSYGQEENLTGGTVSEPATNTAGDKGETDKDDFVNSKEFQFEDFDYDFEF